MNRARPFFLLLFTLAAALFSGGSLAGVPEHVSQRTLAPVHSFVPEAARGEVREVRQDVAAAQSGPGAPVEPPASKPARFGPGERVRNVYLLRSPDSAIGKMASRLEGKDPIVLSAAQFEKNEAVLPKASETQPGPRTGKPGKAVAARVYKDRGVVELQLPGRTELLTLELRPGVPVDQAQLRTTIGAAHRLLFEGPRRPDRIQQTAGGQFVVYSGAVQVIDPRADLLRARRQDRRIVLRTPPRVRLVVRPAGPVTL